ncbi:MAG: hypothetical protein IJV62_02645 [Eggerthellaceae bacterium]|nr:hypothetical protein [Eggerthellaceae bacterium]
MMRENLRKKVITSNTLLLVWFFLDMVGLSAGGVQLVSKSFQDDGLFFVIALVVFMLFLSWEKIGVWVLSAWLVVWGAFELWAHWSPVMLGGGEGLTRFFNGTLKLFQLPGVYIPDLYHIVLHILIVVAAFVTVRYAVLYLRK